MPPSFDNSQAISTATAKESVPSSSSSKDALNNDCNAFVIPTNPSLVEDDDEKLSNGSENSIAQLMEQRDAENSEDISLLNKGPEGKEQQQDCDHSTTTTLPKLNSEECQKETATGNDEEWGEIEKKKEPFKKPETSDNDSDDEIASTDPEQKSNTKQNTSRADDMQWHSPFSMPRVKESDDNGSEASGKNDKGSDMKNDAKENEKIDPLKMLKKGAVAAVGGTMVGIGLVMVPLPTPFGAVVASSGLAVLGTEFDEAKELNDRLIDGAKGQLSKARDSIVKGIENMNQDDLNATSGSSHTKASNSDDNSVPTKENGEAGSVVKINAAASFGSGNDGDGSESEKQEHGEGAGASDNPLWLHMNPIERDRQERLAREKYRRENQTTYEQAKEDFRKRTGKFLSRNLLPLIKKTEPSAAETSTADSDASATIAKNKDKKNGISINENGENLECNGNPINTKQEEEEAEESRTSETGDDQEEEEDGFVVVCQEGQEEDKAAKLNSQEPSIKEGEE